MFSTTILPGIESTNSGNYHNLHCCEQTRGIDSLLSRYREDREQVLSMIKSDPGNLVKTIWKRNSPLATDNECQCKMGAGEQRTMFACAQCKSLRRLVDFRLGGTERPFQVECGELVGKKLVITISNIPVPFLSWDDGSAKRARHYINKYQELIFCGTKISHNLRCITGDTFTIRTLVTWIIMDHFRETELSHVPFLHTSFVCSGVGYSLYEMPNIGSLTELQRTREMSEEIVRGIIVQLVVVFLELSKINFSHGSPSREALIFTEDPVSYFYDDFHVKSPVTLKLSDMRNSSVTVGDVHYFPMNMGLSMNTKRTPFVPEIVVKPGVRTVMYRLDSSTEDMYITLRHIGFPVHVGSFDFYSFMVSLMCDRRFFEVVAEDKRLYEFWSAMWCYDELDEIEELVERGGYSTVYSIIKGRWLRCNVLEHIWNIIKKQGSSSS